MVRVSSTVHVGIISVSQHNYKHSAHNGHNVVQLKFNPGLDISQSRCLDLNPESGSVWIVATKRNQNIALILNIVSVAELKPEFLSSSSRSGLL